MTAVEYLYKLSKKRELDKFDFEQAKEKEKQQIIDAWSKGYDEDDRASSTPLKYYEETFKKD